MNKLRLFENTYNKLVADKTFMAYYLHELIIRENKTQEEVCVLLNCDQEGYYKLALCKAPEIISADFKQRVLKIAEYTNTPALVLSNIIGFSVEVKKEIQDVSVFQKLINDIKQIFPVPEWLVKSKPAIYNTFVTVCSIILFVFIFSPQKQDTKSLQLYMSYYYEYTDAIKYTQVQDNTFVLKNKM